MRIRVVEAEISWVSFSHDENSQWHTFVNMAAKRLTLERKTIRTNFKDIYVSCTTSQTKCKSDQYKPRYRQIKLYFGGHFENCHGGRHGGYISVDFAPDIHNTS